MDEKTALTYAIARALAYQENGGKPNLNKLKAGQSGELKSIYQFTPDTWKHDAQTYLGDSKAELTPDNETLVMTKKIGQWIDEGKTVKQMASIHNAGAGEPDAYTGTFSNGKPSIGVNSYGIKFNVPKYADGVTEKAISFYKNELAPQAQQTTQVSQSTPKTTQASNVKPNGLLGGLTLTKLGASSSEVPTQNLP